MDKKKRKKKKKFSIKKFMFFIIYQILFLSITGIILVFHGPFHNVKKILVGTAMSTFKHQYIATLFLSKDEISKMVNNSKVYDKQDVGDIQISGDEDKSITRYNVHQNRFDGYILEIKDPKRVKVACTSKIGVQGQRVSEMAKERKAIAAINGGGFFDKNDSGKEWVGTGAYPEGLVISDGKIVRNNLKDDEEVDVMAFDDKGKLIVGKKTFNELKKMNLKEALTFNRTLIVNGKPQVEDEGEQGLQPRTAIGQKRDGTVVFIVIDGRKLFKEGASLKDLQDVLLEQGVWNAGNLDGGSSSTMYYKGEIINNPCNSTGERTVATAFYVAP
ncbi:phosphodiester glycosidase family protein [Clostridium rectalis]|uniref:phosphodiester glycosidase family protein n=1 Tax=Clostridium rectalis TaxID=2040295 RepID=UPI000F64209C|nr:phosphodiester glycosidase family protein [Clostridium rectalis]